MIGIKTLQIIDHDSKLTKIQKAKSQFQIINISIVIPRRQMSLRADRV